MNDPFHKNVKIFHYRSNEYIYYNTIFPKRPPENACKQKNSVEIVGRRGDRELNMVRIGLLKQIFYVASQGFGKADHHSNLRFTDVILTLFIKLNHAQRDTGRIT